MSADDRSTHDSVSASSNTSTTSVPKPSQRRRVAKPSAEEKRAMDAAKADQLAERLLTALESQRQLGGDAYPTPESRLAAECGSSLKQKVYRDALKTERFVADVTLLKFKKSKGSNQPAPPSLVVFKSDLDDLGLIRRLVATAAQAARTPRKQIHALSSLNVSSGCDKEARSTITRMLGKLAAQSPLDPPPGLGMLRSNATVYAFLLDDVAGGSLEAVSPREVVAPSEPKTPPPPIAPQADFASAFREAFARLDQRNGRTNFVRLLELRHALPQFDRESFDAGLHELRSNWEYSLDAHEGLHVQISPEERASGIQEMGSLLIYVSRR